MIRWIDDRLNGITMYKLVLYYLIALIGIAVLLSFTGVLAYDPYAILFSTAFLLAVCALTNGIFARTYNVPSNAESSYITALILALIITPIQSYNDLWFLGWAAVLAMASKYILAFKGKHIFNPAAFAVALTYFTINQSASWWVGDASLLPFVLIGGLLLTRKLRRFDMVLSFFITVGAALLVSSLFNGADPIQTIQRSLLYSPLLFLGFVMLTEPLTAPPVRKQRMIYGALIGFLFTPVVHFGTFYTTPELALLIGNLYSYIVSPKVRLVLNLKAKRQIAADVYEFIFTPSKKFAFAPGQYMEWTLAHEDPDSRGNRRYFTLASSPTENELKLGVKFYQDSSSFKQALLSLNREHEIMASQLSGDFVLPANPHQKIVLIAGGIGVTPFRSMIKYLLDRQQKRPITLFYANRTIYDILYKDLFDRAARELGIQVIYTVDQAANPTPDWVGKVGFISPDLIKKNVPHIRNNLFYISGPPAMVDAFKDMLRKMGVKESRIKTDFFSGL